jgi:hypothetical protein
VSVPLIVAFGVGDEHAARAARLRTAAAVIDRRIVETLRE